MKEHFMKNVDFLHLGENGNIAFARFKESESFDRKIDDDVAFLKAMLGAKEEDDFRLKMEVVDNLGITHKKFQQYYCGIKVDNTEYLLHGRNGKIEVMGGDYQNISLPSIKPNLNEPQALSKALEYVGAKKYVWEEQSTVGHPKPKGELMISKDYLKGSNAFKLSWKFTIVSLEPYDEKMIFVDAVNGEIINDVSVIIHANTPGTAQTRYSGTQAITCDSYASGYRLYEVRNTTSGNSAVIHTKDLVGGSSPLITTSLEFSNTNTNWASGSWAAFGRSQHALDAHWGAEKVLDYWRTIHNRNGINNLGMGCTGYVHAIVSGTTNNAGWHPTRHDVAYGDGNGITYYPFTALDVVAHEFGHGIVQFTPAGLTANVYAESAALNEGFCDIWAASVKNWATPTKPIWRLASEIFPIGSPFNCIRDMQNPKSIQSSQGSSPNTYQGTYWDFANGWHKNSTVLSHWFYLLSQGGTGTNDKGFSYSFTGIGITKAEKIAYQALFYLYASSNFLAARSASLQAAVDLYGVTSPEVATVTNAWNAVGVVYPTINLGFHRLGGSSSVVVSVSGTGIVGVINLTSSYNYQLTNFTGLTIVQNVSVPSGNQIYLEEAPRGHNVVTGEMTSNMTVTYYVFGTGAYLENLILKFGVQ